MYTFLCSYAASNKEQAIDEVETDETDVKVWTDSSCIDGHIGVAAILYKEELNNR